MDWEGYWSVSDLVSHAYCPRITWFAHVLGIRQRGTVKTEEGRRVHDEWVHREQVRRYAGERWGARAKLLQIRLVSEELGLQGILDAVVADDGLMIPFDLKNTPEPRQPWPGQRLQLAAYSLLLDEAHPGKVASFGLVHYLQAGRTRRVTIRPEDVGEVLRLLAEMRAVRDSEEMPPRAAPARSVDCFYRKLCV